jgi:hypothetical protein
MSNVNDKYAPGVCNIGRAEIRARLRIGWFGLIVTAVLWIMLILLHAPLLWGLLLFLPASSGVTGFLQAALHFCAGFGMRGVFNFGDKLNAAESVTAAEFRRHDRNKALRIMLFSCLIGAVITLGAVFTLYWL